MSATVDIQTKRVDNILSVPIQAVTTRDDTSSVRSSASRNKSEKESVSDSKTKITEYVFVVDGEKASIREVKTGVQDNTYIEILEGINEGDEIITGPYRVVSKSLRNGDVIKVVDKNQLFDKEKKK
jgi:HlyD family secretion protein